MSEERKTITHYNDYEISNLWNVRSYKKWKLKLLKNQTDGWWYSIINLCKDGKVKTYTIHRLVAEEFIKKVDGKTEINHKNWIKSENMIDNLEWCTHRENLQHRYTHLWMKWPKPWLWKFWKDNKASKSILQYDLLWNLIKEWWGILEASRWLWLNRHCIWKVCNWKQESHGGRKRAFNF